jgi:hypothetical protein
MTRGVKPKTHIVKKGHRYEERLVIRRGFYKELAAVFAEARTMVRCGDPDTFDDEDARINELEKETLAYIRGR